MHSITAYKKSVCARSPCRLLHAVEEWHVGNCCQKPVCISFQHQSNSMATGRFELLSSSLLPFLDICVCLKHSQQVGSGENYQDRKGITCRLSMHTRHHGASRTAAHKFCSFLCCSYLEQEQHMFLAANCLDVDFAGTQNHMQIDLASVEALELIKPLAAGASSKKGTSLYRYTAHYTVENTVAHPRCSCSRVALQHTCSCCSIVVTFQSGHA